MEERRQRKRQRDELKWSLTVRRQLNVDRAKQSHFWPDQTSHQLQLSGSFKWSFQGVCCLHYWTALYAKGRRMLQLGINYTPGPFSRSRLSGATCIAGSFYPRLFRVLMNMCPGAKRGASHPFKSPSSLNRHVYVIIIKALNVRVHQFCSVSAGQMPLSAIMILSSQAALCCTTLMGFLLAVPGKATASWTLITKQALLCSESAQGPGSLV